jgi:hypothetical protein
MGLIGGEVIVVPEGAAVAEPDWTLSESLRGVSGMAARETSELEGDAVGVAMETETGVCSMSI